jgi:hypothetical protein
LGRKPQEFALTGTCPMREHTGDGVYVGRCDFATYEGHCPRHGNVQQFLGEDADLTAADDRAWPGYPERDYGSPALSAFLGHTPPRKRSRP